MGTRADFYVGRGVNAKWLGSVAWDGYPSGFDDKFFKATTEEEWVRLVEAELSGRNDATFPDMGWPWPWENSKTTDYSYAFDDGKVWASCFGYQWFDPLLDAPEPKCDGPKQCVFPEMDTSKFTTGRRSGLILL